MVHSDVPVVKSTLIHNGFIQTDGNDWCVCWAGKGFAQKVYDDIKPYQKINHYPGSICIAYKDQLAAHITKMQKFYGKDKFDFTPETFILPEDYTEFYSFYNVRKQQQLNTLWIVKPNSLAQGKGIYIVLSLFRCLSHQK